MQAFVRRRGLSTQHSTCVVEPERTNMRYSTSRPDARLNRDLAQKAWRSKAVLPCPPLLYPEVHARYVCLSGVDVSGRLAFDPWMTSELLCTMKHPSIPT